MPTVSSSTPIRPTATKPSFRRVLRECPDFRLLFWARTISLFGDWFSVIAILAMLRQTIGSSPTAIGTVFILKLLPYFLAGPLAGVVADRFSRKAIMLISDALRIVFVLGLIAAPWSAWPLATTYVLIALQVAASAFFEPARTAALPHLVPDSYLATANAVGAVVWSLMFTFGAALGGVVTDWFGWQSALTIDAATYLVSVLLLWRMQLPRREAWRAKSTDWMTLTGLGDMRDGLRFVAGRPDVATVMSLKSGWGLAGAVTLLLTLFGERDYALGGRPDLGVALLYTARAIGTGIGPLLARRFVTEESPRAMRRLMTIAMLWSCALYLLFAVAHHWLPASLAVTAAHFGGSIVWVYSTVMLQRMVPDEFRGRVMAADLGLMTLITSASLWLYGWLAESVALDLRTLTVVMALTLVVPAAAWWWAAGRWPVGRP